MAQRVNQSTVEPTPIQPDPVLKTPSIANYIGVSVSTVLRAEKAGKMPIRRTYGRGVRGLPLSVVKAWLANPADYMANQPEQ